MRTIACRRGRLSGTLALAVLATLLFAGMASAAEIRGTATDAAGGALSGATITLENVASGAQSTQTTDAKGHYTFSSIGIGIYRVSASLTGFSEDARTVAVAGPEEALDVNFSLTVGNLVTTVTVTASRSARDVLVVPQPVETLTQAEIHVENPTSTGDAMVQAAGITPVGNGPFQVRPRLRGLDSSRILILVDGERLNNARVATDRAGVEVGLADISSIESVEVVSGSGSVLYGTDALTGTINIITSQPRFADTTRFTGGLDGYYSSNENGARGTATLGMASKRVALSVSGTLESFDDYKAGDPSNEDTRPLFSGPCTLGGTTHNPCLTQADTIDTNFPPFDFNAFPDPFNAPYVRTTDVIPRSSFDGDSLSASALVSVTDNQAFRVKYTRRHADDVGFPDFATPQFFQGIVLPFSNLDKVSGRYQVRNINSWFSSLTATAYWQHQNRLLRNIDIPIQFPAPTARTFFPINVFRLLINSDTEQDIHTVGFDLQNNFLLSYKNVLTAGFTAYRDRSEDERTSSTQLNLVGQVALGPRGPAPIVFPSLLPLGPPTVTHPVRVPDSSFRDIGVFVQDEWDVSARFRVVAGVRLDSYDVSTDATTGYTIAPLIAGANPPIDPSTLPDVNGDSVSRTAFTGDVGIVYRASDMVSLLAHYGRSYRHPNLEELLFSGPATIGNIVPNIKVGPEKGDNIDVGVKVRSGKVAGSLGYFHNRYHDFISTEIVSRAPAGLLSQAINFAEVRIQGVEGQVEAPFTVGRALVTVFANAAYNHGDILEATNPFTGASLDDTPQDNITPFKAITGLRVADSKDRYWLEYSNRIQKKVERVANTLADSPFLIAQDIYGLNGFTLHRIAGGVDWKQKGYTVGVTAAVENLGDKYYREQFQFAPARGRSFTVGLHLRKL